MKYPAYQYPTEVREDGVPNISQICPEKDEPMDDKLRHISPEHIQMVVGKLIVKSHFPISDWKNRNF